MCLSNCKLMRLVVKFGYQEREMVTDTPRGEKHYTHAGGLNWPIKIGAILLYGKCKK